MPSWNLITSWQSVARILVFQNDDFASKQFIFRILKYYYNIIFSENMNHTCVSGVYIVIYYILYNNNMDENLLHALYWFRCG